MIFGLYDTNFECSTYIHKFNFQILFDKRKTANIMGHVAQCSVNEEAFEFVLATKQWTLGPDSRPYSILIFQFILVYA